MNLARQYAERALLLRNLLDRITLVKGKDKLYTLRGHITQEERNAIVVGLQQMKEEIAKLRLR